MKESKTDLCNMSQLYGPGGVGTALQIANSCWDDAETSGIQMDSRLLMAFAKRVGPLLVKIDELHDRLDAVKGVNL